MPQHIIVVNNKRRLRFGYKIELSKFIRLVIALIKLIARIYFFVRIKRLFSTNMF